MGHRRGDRHARHPGLAAAARRARQLPQRVHLVGPARHGRRARQRAEALAAAAVRGSEEGSAQAEPERYSYTPTLGVFHALTSLNGDVLVSEDRIRRAMLTAGSDAEELRLALDDLLGAPWDEELDVFRQAGEGESLRWLHEVG